MIYDVYSDEEWTIFYIDVELGLDILEGLDFPSMEVPWKQFLIGATCTYYLDLLSD
jgi:hypothetical protein